MRTEIITPDEVKAIRASLGLTQSGLARRLGVDVRTVRRWEIATGVRTRRMAQSLKLAAGRKWLAK